MAVDENGNHGTHTLSSLENITQSLTEFSQDILVDYSFLIHSKSHSVLAKHQPPQPPSPS